MKRLFSVAVFLLGATCVLQAQEPSSGGLAAGANAASDFSATSAASATLLAPFTLAPRASAAGPSHAMASTPGTSAFAASATPAAEPAPAPEPRFVFGGRDDYRWQLAVGVAWFRFRSSIFNASAVGLNTTVSYFTNDWFAIEGSVTAAFAPALADNEHVKLLLYGAGPKIAWRQRRWEPWMHAIFGGAHEQPQTADNSKNAFEIQGGGGADYRWNPRVSFRLEGDYVRTTFFNQTQNNFQLLGGIVFHF